MSDRPNRTSGWVRVSRRAPCPICGKPDNCQVSADGGVVWCGRVADGSLRQNAGGQFLHRLGEVSRPFVAAPLPRPAKRPTWDFAALALELAANAEEARQELAELLSVLPAALAAIGVGWSQADQTWTFPERDATGAIIGINARSRSGDKRRLTGGRAGLTYAADWNTGTGPILLVEGGSDTAALIGLGLSVVGRPSNNGGVDLLSELLSDVPLERLIIVIGERDQKPDGRWPGRDGAVRTVERLTENLRRPIGWCLPPDHAKDARAWLNSRAGCSTERLAALFFSGLETTVVEPPPLYRSESNQGPTQSLETWRQEMLAARVASLTTPGFYLDSSPTGAGKSYVDLIAIQRLIASEAA